MRWATPQMIVDIPTEKLYTSISKPQRTKFTQPIASFINGHKLLVAESLVVKGKRKRKRKRKTVCKGSNGK